MGIAATLLVLKWTMVRMVYAMTVRTNSVAMSELNSTLGSKYRTLRPMCSYESRFVRWCKQAWYLWVPSYMLFLDLSQGSAKRCSYKNHSCNTAETDCAVPAKITCLGAPAAGTEVDRQRRLPETC